MGRQPGIWRDSNLRNLLLITAGCVLFALSYILFLKPNQIANGGVSGIAMTINYFTGFPMGTMTIILNVPIILFALYRLGRKTVASTLFALVLSSVLTDAGLLVLGPFTDDLLLASLYGGVLQGAGMGLIFLGSAAVGGTSLLSRIVRSYYPQVKMGKIVLLIDTAIIVVSSVSFQNINLALYAAISLYLSTKVIDLILYGMDTCLMAHVISSKPEELGRAIQQQLTHNVTYLTGSGGYTGESRQVIYCVVHRSQSAELGKLIKSVDPAAFVTMIEAKEAYGGSIRK